MQTQVDRLHSLWGLLLGLGYTPQGFIFVHIIILMLPPIKKHFQNLLFIVNSPNTQTKFAAKITIFEFFSQQQLTALGYDN